MPLRPVADALPFSLPSLIAKVTLGQGVPRLSFECKGHRLVLLKVAAEWVRGPPRPAAAAAAMMMGPPHRERSSCGNSGAGGGSIDERDCISAVVPHVPYFNGAGLLGVIIAVQEVVGAPPARRRGRAAPAAAAGGGNLPLGAASESASSDSDASDSGNRGGEAADGHEPLYPLYEVTPVVVADGMVVDSVPVRTGCGRPVTLAGPPPDASALAAAASSAATRPALITSTVTAAAGSQFHVAVECRRVRPAWAGRAAGPSGAGSWAKAAPIDATPALPGFPSLPAVSVMLLFPDTLLANGPEVYAAHTFLTDIPACAK
jgi:hypothetical protein